MNTIGFKIDDYFIWSENQNQAIERYLMIKNAKGEEPNMELLNNMRSVSEQENVIFKKSVRPYFSLNFLKLLMVP